MMKKQMQILAKIILVLLIIVSAAVPLTVFAASGATSLSFEKGALRVAVGRTFNNPIVATPESTAVTYTSSEPKVATVNSKGQVICLSVGKTVITAKSGEASASYNLRIVPASTGDPLKDAINEMELKPLIIDDWSKSFYERIDKIVSEDMTNYQKMRAVYDDVVKNFDKQRNCVGYAVGLQCAFEAIGFRTYHIRGLTKTTAGGWTEHSWVGVDIGETLYYFDASLPGRYNAPDRYFAIPQKTAQSYKDAFIMKLYINPETDIFPSLDAGEITKTVAERKALLSVEGAKEPDFFYWSGLTG